MRAPGRRVSVGAGQMSRVDSVKIGAMKAVLPLQGTVVASDAFFPFPDGVEEAARHGITAVIQPGGSVRDEEVIAAANRLGLAMVFTGRAAFPALTWRRQQWRRCTHECVRRTLLTWLRYRTSSARGLPAAHSSLDPSP